MCRQLELRNIGWHLKISVARTPHTDSSFPLVAPLDTYSSSVLIDTEVA